MVAFLKQIRWAIVLPILQGTIFVTITMLGHRESIVQNRQGEVTTRVYWVCLELYANPRVREEPSKLVVDCYPSLLHGSVMLSNFPVLLSSAIVAELAFNREISQIWLFYGINGVGIPLFWYWIGTRIDRRLRRGPGNAPSPP